MKKNLFLLLLNCTISYGQIPGAGCTDIDGNNYNTIIMLNLQNSDGAIVGDCEWMKSNLNVSKYSDGTIIPQVTSLTTWASLTTGAWCYYNNSSSLGNPLGKLYNWYAYMGIYDTASLNNPSLRKKLAPEGWHVATYSDWDLLVYNRGGWAGSGGATGNVLKEAGTQYWNSPDGPNVANNSSNFTARGAGYRSEFGFSDKSITTHFWTEVTTSNQTFGRTPSLEGSFSMIYISSWPKHYGLSVRCVKNSQLPTNTFDYKLIKLYPNPAKDKFTIDFGNELLSNYTIKINNLLGQEVFSNIIDKPQFEVTKTWQGQGIYFVKIYNENKDLVGTKKIIIQ